MKLCVTSNWPNWHRNCTRTTCYKPNDRTYNHVSWVNAFQNNGSTVSHRFFSPAQKSNVFAEAICSKSSDSFIDRQLFRATVRSKRKTISLCLLCAVKLRCSSETGLYDTGSTTFQAFIILPTCIKQQGSACKASPSIMHDPLRKKDLNI